MRNLTIDIEDLVSNNIESEVKVQLQTRVNEEIEEMVDNLLDEIFEEPNEITQKIDDQIKDFINSPEMLSTIRGMVYSRKDLILEKIRMWLDGTINDILVEKLAELDLDE